MKKLVLSALLLLSTLAQAELRYDGNSKSASINVCDEANIQNVLDKASAALKVRIGACGPNRLGSLVAIDDQLTDIYMCATSEQRKIVGEAAQDIEALIKSVTAARLQCRGGSY